MQENNTISNSTTFALASKVKDYFQLIKFTLSFMANSINQALEKNTDALMKRTAKRPVASGRMSVSEAYTFAAITGILGVGMMWYFFNFQSAMIGLFSLFLYGFIYTPLKKVNSVAVLIGAIPGALPCLIGWVAATDNFSAGGWKFY